MLERLRALDENIRRQLIGALFVSAATLPLIVNGPGNDLDVGGVFRSGRSIARHFGYVPSRPPGAPVHEFIVGILDLLGGALLTNSASLVAALVGLWALDRLLAREGVPAPGRLGVAIVGANPWFLIAASSTADYVFALMFVLLAALSLRSGRPVAAGLLGAAAIGCRVGTVALLAGLLIAELTDGPEHRKRAVRSAITMGTGAIVLFIPSFLYSGGISFAQNDFSTSSPIVQLGRALVKDFLLLGPFAAVAALLAVPAIWRSLRTWRTSWLIRFAVPSLLIAQALFIRFPWKMAHLLPCLLCIAIILSVALSDKPKLLLAIAGLQFLFAIGTVNFIAPDDPNQATGATIDVNVGWGPLVTDWQCRRDNSEAYRGRQRIEIEAAWDCAKPFGG